MFRGLTNNLLELPQHFRVVDGLDILLIALVLYAVFLWIRRTISRNAVIFLACLVALYLTSRAMDMYLTTLLFHTAFAVLLVVLVIIFQDDLRRSYDRIASWGSHEDSPHDRLNQLADANSLVEAIFSMAGRRIGALVVIRGREPLSRHINGGIQLSGTISGPILYSIFDPNSAGHDGAVIVERGRIESFGVHLPISKNHKEIKGRGTRHSAALGLAEVSDAFTIVVSEERGVVSVAEDSKLVEMSNAASLAARVHQFVTQREPKGLLPSWKSKLFRDLPLKAAALIVSAIGWFVLSFQGEQVQTSIVVPIEYRNVPSNAEIDPSTPADALVTIRGTERAFRQLDRRVLKISINLQDIDESTETITIRPEDVRRPPNLKVDRIQPAEIRVRIRRQFSRTDWPARSKQYGYASNP